MNPSQDPDLRPLDQPSVPADPLTPQTDGKKPKKHAVLIIIGLVILVLGLGAITWKAFHKTKPQTNTNSSQSSVTGTAQVSITAEGLTPSTIQIKPGTQLTWTNTDTKEHQIAADPYPADSSIDGFDSTVVLAANETQSFTFSKAGTYTYHDEKDHANKAYQGTIIVK